MKVHASPFALALLIAASVHAHDGSHAPSAGSVNAPAFFTENRVQAGSRMVRTNRPMRVEKTGLSSLAAKLLLQPLMLSSVVSGPTSSFFTPPAGYGAMMASSFGRLKPDVRFYWDSNYFYVESDGLPSRTLMPTPMKGITAWQQQIPLPVAYFSDTTNPDNDPVSLGFGQPNVWKLPMVPTPSASPIPINTVNFLRGAVAVAVNGIAIFNPANNRGEYSYDIGELDMYGGHSGRADDYHYHIVPMHLQSVTGVDKPVAWALDGYPIYGYTEPDGSAMQALDAQGGHDIGHGWGYHYHARGSVATGPAQPFMMTAFHGTVVNYGGQVDPQPEVRALRGDGTGGYNATIVPGAAITDMMNPVALTTDGSGHLIHNPAGTPSKDDWLMRYTVGAATYDMCWRFNRAANPKTMTITWRLPSGTTTTTYSDNAAYKRIRGYASALPSMKHLPDTGQTLSATATPGEDSDYTIYAPSFTDNGNGTITDKVTGLMWQKQDAGEMTWDAAMSGAAGVTLGGYSDWRLPTPTEAMSILNLNNNPALDSTYFTNHPSGTPEYWWTSDVFAGDATKIWVTNKGGGLGPHPKTETISAGGTLRYHARYVRGAPPSTGHNYINNGDGTVTDTDTELMWQQVPGAATTWTGALNYAENLTLGGYSDWRLPTAKELQTLVDISLAKSSTTSGVVPCINRTLFPAVTTTAYWSSTSLRAVTPTEAWVVEFGVNTTSNPPRNLQGIVSYEPYTSSLPVVAVRNAPTRSISQGLATTTTANLLPAGQRVSAVGTITATDATTWTMPAATQFTTATKAPDLYNDVTNVKPANIGAVDLNSVPLVTIDPDGEIITGYIFADNYFELYVNGTLVGVDPVPYTPFNSCVVKFKAKRPITYAFKLVDWEENLGVGSELNGADPYHAGDGGLFASFSDGTVTNGSWKAQSFYIAPLNDPNLVVEQLNGTHDSSAAGLQTPTLNQSSYALHYPVPSNWFAKDFDDSNWPSASTYTEAQVGVTGKPAYTNFSGQFTNSGGSFIWSSNLVLDNEVVVRFTGAAAQPKIAVEQPAGSALTDGVSTVAYGTVNTGANVAKTFTIKNNDTAAMSITGVTIDGADASNFSVTTSPATSIAAGSNTTMVVRFAPTTSGAKTAALHIASSDTVATPAFDIALTGTGNVPPPSVTNVNYTPSSPTSGDAVTVTAQVAAGTGSTLSSVQLTYDLGAQVSGPVWKETFANTSSNNWNGTGALNAWTTVGAGNVRQAIAASNHTSISISNAATTNGSTTVTCTSTASLWPGMLITGPNIPGSTNGAQVGNTTVASITNGTTFVLSQAATGTGSGLTLTAAGVTLTNATTVAGTSVTCDSTAGLVNGMALTGTGLANNATVATVTSATTFTMNAAPTTPGSGLTLSASTAGAEFNGGTANLTDSMFTTTNAINTSGASGYVEFWVQTRDLAPNNNCGWAFQVSPDNGTTWNTRLSEDWNAKTVSLSNCIFNAAGAAAGSTTVTCSDTTGLTTGRSLVGPNVYVTCGLTTGQSTVTCTNTASLVPGMFLQGTGIPNNTRIGTIVANTSFTMVTGTGATLVNATATNAAVSVAATYFPAAATVSSVTNGTTFVISTPAYANTSAASLNVSAAPIAVGATTINHGYQLFHYDLAGAELGTQTKIRFQATGYTPTAPTRSPRISVDDVVVNTTTGAPPTIITMYDDGLHGDGAAGDGVYGATIPAQANGATVNFSIAATDSIGGSTNATGAGTYTVGTGPSITTASPLPAGNTTTAYSQTLAATGGAPSYTWAIQSGSLPSGLTLSSAGLISGTATTAGTFNFTVRVTDSQSRVGTKSFALTIASSTPPNVVVIVTDDQGWADVGYHTAAGQVPIQTPVMDSFATTGIRLERFYCTTVCSVTRSALLTGRQTIRTGVNNTRGLDLSEHLMPQTFKAAGYQTYMCGKWHLGGSDKNLSYTTVNGQNVRIIQEGTEYAPYNRGWDSHYGQYSGAIDYYTHWSAEAENPDHPDWWLNGVQVDGPSEHTDSQGHGGWSPDLLADKAISHIQNRDPNKPILLYLAFNSIHGPVSAPQALIDKYAGLGVTNTGRRLISAAVDGMDQAMGRVLAALDAAGIANNTIVVWFGDNGGDETKGSLNDPLRGDKGDSYEGGLREVAGIRWPGVLPAGVTSNQPMWVGDIFPTLCAATGVTPQNTKPFDGLNMWPSLLAASNSTTVSRGAPLVTDQAAPIAIYQFTDPVNGGTKDFKLRRSKVGATTVSELFNLTDDPYETTDLAANGAYSSILATLTSAITGISVEAYKPYVGPPMITNTVAQGGAVTLYAPFTSYPNGTLSVQWRKNGVPIGGATGYTQVTDTAAALVKGAYTTTYTIASATPTDAATYDVVVTNTAGSTTSASGVVSVALGAPSLSAPAYTKGTSITLTWPAVANATSYTVQRAATSDFASVLSSQVSSTPSVTFSGLTSGSTYYYRATATDGTTTSVFSNVVLSTQDAGNPLIAITAPTDGVSAGLATINVQGTASDAISGVASVTVNGVAATTSDNFAHWSASVPLNVGSNTITATATDNAQTGGNTGTASITVTLTPGGLLVSGVTRGPTSPTYLDPVWVTAQVSAAPGTTISQVQLLYDTGTPVSTKIWQETFANTSSNNWNGTGGLNAWTTVGAGNVRQAIAASNHTSISISNAATTNGSTTVTCTSTASLWPGMLITGPNIPGSTNGAQVGNTTVASITNGTTFVLSQAATGTGSALTLTAAGVTLTNATTVAGTSVTCDSTAGLVNGMALTGTGLANNATVATVTSATTFTMNAAPTTPGSGLTLSASTAGAEFNGGTANLTDSMFTTTNAINTSGASGYVEFWVQTRDLAPNNNCGWAFQVSPDNGTTWNTRLSEDWNAKTVSLSNCVFNAAGAAAGSTTVTCSDTTGLTTGRSLVGPNVYVTCGLTTGQSTVTCTNTASLVPGMFLQGTGIPNNTRIGTIVANTSFTMVTGTGATLVNATATNAAVSVAATYFPAAATVSSVTNGTTFVISTPAYANTSAASLNVSAAPIAVGATTINHGYQLFHYDLTGAELGTQTKIRFQATGYTPTAPTRSPRISVDDVVAYTTAPPPTIAITMYDDGQHGDGAAGDGVYGAQIPALAGGTNVTFHVTAKDSNNVTASDPVAGGYSYSVNAALTDATITNSEFLTIPTDEGVTLTVGAATDQDAYVEYGTAPNSYTSATPPASFPAANGPIRIALTGLQPDTKYYYRLRHRPSSGGAFSARGERSFRTARPRGSSFVFTVTADPHLDVNTDPALLARAMTNISEDHPDFHVDLGDIFMTDKMSDGLQILPQYGGGVAPNEARLKLRASIFRNFFEMACHSVPYFYGLGNHEAEYGYLFNAAADKQNNIPAWNLKARRAYFPAPVPSAFYSGNPTPKDYTGGSLGLLEDYYAWEWGDALFIVLDPFWNTTTNPNTANDAWQWSLGKPQYDWLKTTLQNSSAKYKFVFMHHIVGGSTTLADGTTPQFAARGGVEVADKYEWGGKNADGSDGFATKRPGWDMPIHQLLVQNKVNVVFHGHDHLYAYQQLDGIVYLECPQPGTANYVTLGSAGDGKYTTGTLLPNSGHIRVTVGENQTLAEYVRAYRAADENVTRQNRDVSHSFTVAPSFTQTPVLASPAANSATKSPVSVDFTLPEAAKPGTVKLKFGTEAQTLVLAASQESAGQHTFTFDPADPVATSGGAVGTIASGSIADGTYTVTLSYQDQAGNAVASVSNENVKIDTVTHIPTLTAPASNAIVGGPVGDVSGYSAISFTLPEAAMGSSLKVTFNDGTTQRVLTLGNAQESAGDHTIYFSPTDPVGTCSPAGSITGGEAIPDGGPYTVTLSYRDVLGNTASNSAASTNVMVDTITQTPTFTLPAASTAVKSPVSVSFSLPEAAGGTGGLLTLDFGSTALVLAESLQTAGDHTFTFDPANPVTSGGGAIVSGSAIADGLYTVTLSYRDALANPLQTAVHANVRIDTTAPTISGTFSPLIVYAGTALADYTPQATASDVSGVTVTQQPAAGTVLSTGITHVTLTATDGAGNTATTEFELVVRPTTPPSQALIASGMAAPGAGGPSGLPADATIVSFGVPATDDDGDIAYTAKWKSVTEGSGTGLFKNNECVAIIGGPLPGGTGTFKTFSDPVVDSGHVAFLATFTGVPRGQTSGVLSDASGALAIVAQAGATATLEGATFKLFKAVAIENDVVAFLAQLTAGSGTPKITTTTDMGVWVKTVADPLAPVLNEGLDVLGKKIKTLVSFAVGSGSPGQGRGWLTTSGGAQVAALAKFPDNSQTILARQPGAALLLTAQTGATASGYPPDIAGATFATFGTPAFAGASAAAFRGALTVGGGGVTKADTSGIFALYDENDTAITTIARVGSDAGATGGKFSVLKDPVLSSDLDLAFPATIKGTGITGIAATTLWWKPFGSALTLLARGGAEPADLPGAQWKAFPSLAIAANRGPVFTATLVTGKGGVTSRSATGVWATDFLGQSRLLFRTGAPDAVVTGKTLSSFKLLNATVGSTGVTRSINNAAEVVWLATFTDKTQAIIVTDVP